MAMFLPPASMPVTVGAEPGQRFAQQPAAAADIEDAQPRQRPAFGLVAGEMPEGPVADIGQAHRIELVQRLELAGGSHHSSAMAANLAISPALMVVSVISCTSGGSMWHVARRELESVPPGSV